MSGFLIRRLLQGVISIVGASLVIFIISRLSGDPILILIAWSIGALFALAGALSYAELGINFPSSGGEYVYLTRAFGRAWDS